MAKAVTQMNEFRRLEDGRIEYVIIQLGMTNEKRNNYE